MQSFLESDRYINYLISKTENAEKSVMLQQVVKWPAPGSHPSSFSDLGINHTSKNATSFQFISHLAGTLLYVHSPARSLSLFISTVFIKYQIKP